MEYKKTILWTFGLVSLCCGNDDRVALSLELKAPELDEMLCSVEIKMEDRGKVEYRGVVNAENQFSGKRITDIECEDGENAFLEEEFSFGRREGKARYKKSGRSMVASFRKGMLDGNAYRWLDDKLISCLEFVNGEIGDNYSLWHYNGKMKKLSRGDGKGLLESWEWNEMGKPILAEVRDREKENIYKEYQWHENGLLRMKTIIESGKLRKEYLWDSSGSMVLVDEYDDEECLERSREKRKGKWIERKSKRGHPFDCVSHDVIGPNIREKIKEETIGCGEKKALGVLPNDGPDICSEKFRIWTAVDDRIRYKNWLSEY